MKSETTLFLHLQLTHRIVILGGCDFFDFSCFWYTPPECFSELPQDRHPERSASRIYRLTEGLQRVVEGPRGCLSYLCCSDLFNRRSPHLAVPPRSFPGAENKNC